MKSKKISVIILAVAVFAIAVFSVLSSIAKKPTVTEGEFPFSITYELDGEVVTISDVYKVHYDRNGGYADTKSRIYVGEIGDRGEDNTIYTLKKDENSSYRIELWTFFYPDYLMGDAMYDYFDDEPFAPRILYYDAQEVEYSDEESLAAQGVKLIDFEYPTPIENSFVFSHISYLNSRVVLPSLLIALLAVVAIIIFVKKEIGFRYKAINIFSIIFNFVIGFTLVPFLTIVAMFMDITGGGPEFYYQMFYFLPAFSILCIAASIALRRKVRGTASLLISLVGPFAFTMFLIVCGVLGLL